MPSGTNKFCIRTHRLVILPDYQGLNIGVKFEEFMGEWFLKNNYKMFLRTTHLRLGKHCTNSKLWKPSATNQIQRIGINEQNSKTTQGSKYKKQDDKRIAYSFEYVGENFNTKEHQIIICDGDIEYNKANKILNNILNKEKFPIIVSGIAEQNITNVWEEIALKLNIRTDILYIKRNNQYFINQKFVKNNFDCIVTTIEAQEQIKPYLKKCNKCFTYYFDNQKNPIKEYYSNNYSLEIFN